MPYRVIIVDDQKMQRIALESFLQGSGNYTVVGSFASAELAVSFCRLHRVDLVIMDIVMAVGINGIAATAKIKEKQPKTKVVLVTSMPEVSYLKRAREAGADSLWYKEYEGRPLTEVLDRTMKGETIYPDTTPALPLGNASSMELTGGELEVLRKVVTGKTDQEISDALHISVWTVRSHIKHMLQKTGYKNRVELAVRARTAGLVIDD